MKDREYIKKELMPALETVFFPTGDTEKEIKENRRKAMLDLKRDLLRYKERHNVTRK